MSHGCQLYRHFDAAGVLLYVGIAVCTVRRTREHIKRSGWYGDISRIEIEKFADRNAALSAESAAILREQPKFNKQKTFRSASAATSPKKPERAPAGTFDRRAYQRAYMVEWRKRQKEKTK